MSSTANAISTYCKVCVTGVCLAGAHTSKHSPLTIQVAQGPLSALSAAAPACRWPGRFIPEPTINKRVFSLTALLEAPAFAEYAWDAVLLRRPGSAGDTTGRSRASRSSYLQAQQRWKSQHSLASTMTHCAHSWRKKGDRLACKPSCPLDNEGSA